MYEPVTTVHRAASVPDHGAQKWKTPPNVGAAMPIGSVKKLDHSTSCSTITSQ
jgi:hypothetical protein